MLVRILALSAPDWVINRVRAAMVDVIGPRQNHQARPLFASTLQTAENPLRRGTW
jgi:hypothetical protein